MNATEKRLPLRERVRDKLMSNYSEKFRGKDLFDAITSSRRNIPALASLLSDKEPVVRILATACLCRVFRNGGDISKYRPQLEELMKSDPDETVRMHASFVTATLAEAGV